MDIAGGIPGNESLNVPMNESQDLSQTDGGAESSMVNASTFENASANEYESERRSQEMRAWTRP